MGFVGLRTTNKQDKDIDELETELRRIKPHVTSKSAAIKEAIKLALWYIKSSPLYKPECLTEAFKPANEVKQTRDIVLIPSSEIDIYGSRKKKP